MAPSLRPAQPDHAGPGRPRAFDIDAAVDAGVAVLRRRGYEATSLDDLTRAMGISRSSFYAAFGSKRGVLLTALDRYSRQRLQILAELAAGPEPLGAILAALAGVVGDGRGCLLVNCLEELGDGDAEISDRVAAHMARIEGLIREAAPEAGAAGVRALLATAVGAQTLRKSGAAPAVVDDMLHLAATRLARPG